MPCELCLAAVVLVALLTPQVGGFHDKYYEDMRCEECDTGSFCTGGGRVGCPLNSVSDFSHLDGSPSDVEDCVCLPGFNRTGDACGLAPPGAFFYVEGLAFPCPQHARTYQHGPSQPEQCVCEPGYFSDGGVCRQCGEGSFNPTENQTECQLCPGHSSHLSRGSFLVTDCVCDAGAYSVSADEQAVVCNLCAGGGFKGAPGPEPCTPCGNNSHSDGQGATECLSCHANSEAPAGSDSSNDCECIAGFGQDAPQGCSACAVGTFKSSTSHEACAPCGAGTFANTTKQLLCHPCGPLSLARVDRAGCLCIPGHTTFPARSDDSAPACESCPEDHYKEGDNQAPCTPCGTFMTSLPASESKHDCLCGAGYAFTGSNVTCVACGPGTYKTNASNGPPETDCRACPPHSLSPPASTNESDCACNAGFMPDALQGGCDHCDPGFFKGAPGPAPCESCGTGTYNPHLNATRCFECYADATSPAESEALTACVCPAGSELNAPAHACEACPAGSFGSSADGVCTPCANGDYTVLPGAVGCSECEQHSSSHDAPHVACQCDPGYDTEQPCPSQSSCLRCQACPAGSYKQSPGDVGCTECQANAESQPGSVDEDACRCAAGYSQNGTHLCMPCGPGSFSDALDALECGTCGEDRYANESATAECHHCWYNSGNNPEHTGCDCLPGFTPLGKRGCTACGADTYKMARDNSQCLSCRNNSQSEPGSTHVDHCGCDPGFFLESGSGEAVCTACREGSFKTEPGNHACTGCPLTTTTESTQAVLSSDCVCPPGLGFQAAAESDCAACPANSYKPGFSNTVCTPCRSNSSSPADVAALDEYDCLCNAGFDDFPRHTPRVCEACAPGEYKGVASNAACAECGPETFSGGPGALACEACGASSSTLGLSGRSVCGCNVGFARRGGGETACESCDRGMFKNNVNDMSCSVCLPCAIDEEVLVECNSSAPVVCAACPVHSSSLGRPRSLAGHCACNAGYEFRDDSCVACGPGTYKDHTNNSFACVACPAGEFTTGNASTTCAACDARCENTGAEAFVSAECGASHDVVCTACQVCVPGTLASTRCGPGFGNDREDTVCGVCPAGFFCEGDAHIEACTTHSSSPNGSSLVGSCGCVPGYRGDETGCQKCGFDTYCFEGEEHECPAHSITDALENSVVLDCHCHSGFFRVQDDTPGIDNFTCAVCTVDDFCFGDQRFNCSDDRMRAAPRSDAPSDCVCVDGFYNNQNHSACLDCSVDHFCVNGSQFACSAEQWTQDEIRQSECTCRPGLRSEHNRCVPCGASAYCPGDNFSVACRANSEVPGSLAQMYSDCLCSKGHGEARPVGSPAVCELCASGSSFSPTVINEACQNCTECDTVGLYASVWCETKADAVCDSCSACDGAEEFTRHACSMMTNADCAPCQQCNFTSEYESQACAPSQDRHCTAFSQDSSTCGVGFYRGGHAHDGNSMCLPCLYNDTQLNGQSMHASRTFGQEYDNAFSCGATCLGNSRMRDEARQYLGCVSCETGNVLYKRFPTSMATATVCNFTCHAGYERVRRHGVDDCERPRLKADARSRFSHDLSVGDYSWADGVSQVRVSHTDHGLFVVVVGPAAPSGCKLGGEGCCFEALRRVSTLVQMGLSAPPETAACTGLSGLSSVRESSSGLSFSVPDAYMTTVASCSEQGETRVCVLVVTLVDMLTWRTVSKTLEMRTTRSVVLAHSTPLKQMIPFSAFEVRVELWRVLPAGEHIFQLETLASGASMRMQTRVLHMTQLAQAPLCERASRASGRLLQVGDATDVVPDTNSSTVSYWQAGAHVDTVKVVFHLTMSNQSQNVMDVAAVRDARVLVPMCSAPPPAVEYGAGLVWSTSGLGEGPVFRLRQGAGERTAGPDRGKLATLLTFVCESTMADNSSISLGRILAGHVRTQADKHRLVNATEYKRGVQDFTFEFRSWCLSVPRDCQYEYINVYAAHTNLFQLSSCALDEQARAVAWLRANFGVAHDAGHVAAVCGRHNALRPIRSMAVLVNTMKYTHRQRDHWNMYQNSSAPEITSYVWVDFRITPS